MIIGLSSKMVLASIKIKNKSYYFWDDIVYLNDLDCGLLKLVKRELRVEASVYHIGYIVRKHEYNINSVNLLYLSIRHLLGRVEKKDGSNDKYLVVDESNKEVLSAFEKLWKFIESKIIVMKTASDKITFGSDKVSIKGWNKLRFSSSVDLPLDTLIEFHALTIVINCIIEKGNKYYPEIYLDKGLYETDIV